VGVLVNMESQPRQLHFYRNDSLLEGQSLSGFPLGVYLCATPEERDVQVAISFPNLPTNWREVVEAEEITRKNACREAEEALAAEQKQAADSALREDT
jgi:hypothetical protein